MGERGGYLYAKKGIPLFFMHRVVNTSIHPLCRFKPKEYRRSRHVFPCFYLLAFHHDFRILFLEVLTQVIISYSVTDNIYCVPVRIMMKKYTPVTRHISCKSFDGDAC